MPTLNPVQTVVPNGETLPRRAMGADTGDVHVVYACPAATATVPGISSPNGDILYTAIAAGPGPDPLRVNVIHVVNGLSTPRSIAVAAISTTCKTVIVYLATDGAGAVASSETAASIAAAVNADPAAGLLVSAVAQGTGLALCKATLAVAVCFANGNDTTGDGSAAAPYRTHQRAQRDIPLSLTNSYYIVDSTSAGPAGDREIVQGLRYDLRAFVGSARSSTFLASDFGGAFPDPFKRLMAKNTLSFMALPVVVETLPAASVLYQVADPHTGLRKIGTNKSFTAEQHRARFVLVVDPNDTSFLETAPIASCSAGPNSVLEICRNSDLTLTGTKTAFIVEESWNLHNSDGSNLEPTMTIQCPTQINLWGLKITGATPGNSQIMFLNQSVSFRPRLCTFQTATLSRCWFFELIGCVVGSSFAFANTSVLGGGISRSLFNGTSFGGTSSTPGRASVSQCALLNCTAAPGAGTNPEQPIRWAMTNSLIRGGTVEGYIFNGGAAQSVQSTRVENCVRAAITATGPAKIKADVVGSGNNSGASSAAGGIVVSDQADLEVTAATNVTGPLVALGGQSGAAASLAPSSATAGLRVSGLTGMTSGSVGNYLTLTGAANPVNNGTFLITAFSGSSTVDVAAYTGVAASITAATTDANSGAISWVEKSGTSDIKAPNREVRTWKNFRTPTDERPAKLEQDMPGIVSRPFTRTFTGLAPATSFDLTTIDGVGETVGAGNDRRVAVANGSTLRVTAAGTAAVGTRLLSDAGDTPSSSVATLSTDGKTVTFEGTVTGFVISYSPAAPAASGARIWQP